MSTCLPRQRMWKLFQSASLYFDADSGRALIAKGFRFGSVTKLPGGYAKLAESISHWGPMTVHLTRSLTCERNCTPLLPVPSGRLTWNLRSKLRYVLSLMRNVWADLPAGGRPTIAPFSAFQ